eukprot:3605199-Rhodomonas_salina.1
MQNKKTRAGKREKGSGGTCGGWRGRRGDGERARVWPLRGLPALTAPARQLSQCRTSSQLFQRATRHHSCFEALHIIVAVSKCRTSPYTVSKCRTSPWLFRSAAHYHRSATHHHSCFKVPHIIMAVSVPHTLC